MFDVCSSPPVFAQGKQFPELVPPPPPKRKRLPSDRSHFALCPLLPDQCAQEHNQKCPSNLEKAECVLLPCAFQTELSKSGSALCRAQPHSVPVVLHRSARCVAWGVWHHCPRKEKASRCVSRGDFITVSRGLEHSLSVESDFLPDSLFTHDPPCDLPNAPGCQTSDILS